MEQTKPKIRSGTDLQWYCECGWATPSITYPIDLTKDSVEIICQNPECRFCGKVIGVRLDQREVLYVSDPKNE